MPAVLVLLVLIYQLRQGLFVFGARLINPSFSMGALLVVILLGLWRVAAVGHAFLTGESLQTRRILDRVVVGALVATILISHSAAGYILWVSHEAGSRAFTPENPNLIDQATPAPRWLLERRRSPPSRMCPRRRSAAA